MTFEQTFGSALNANLHFHVLVAYGAWSKGEAVFHAAPVLTTDEVHGVVNRVRPEGKRCSCVAACSTTRGSWPLRTRTRSACCSQHRWPFGRRWASARARCRVG